MDRAWCVQLVLVGGQLLAKGTSNRSNFQGANKELRPSRELLVVGTVHGQIAKVTGQDLGKWQAQVRHGGHITLREFVDERN